MSLDALCAVNIETFLDVVDFVVNFSIRLVWKPVFWLNVLLAILESGYYRDKVVKVGNAVISVALALDKLCKFYILYTRDSEYIYGNVDA